jgi:2-phosphoglycerate kinase
VVRVVLIGGPPGAGKSTLGRALAARLEAKSVTVDDLMSAARAVTTPESHPGLHVMARTPFAEYFTEGPVERLIADAETQSEAVWPIIEKVARDHARWGPPLVLDGWTLRPGRVSALGLSEVRSLWLAIDPAVLEARERENTGFTSTSSDPERMHRNFMGRSLWANTHIREQATAQSLPVLFQDGAQSVEALCDAAMPYL